MRALSLTHLQRLAMLASTVLVAACGGAIEGRYTPRGDALFESFTLGEDGRVDVVFIGQPAVGSYVVEGDSVTLTAPNGDKVLFAVGDDGCLTNSIIGSYCRSGDAQPQGSGGGAVATSSSAVGGPEAYEAVTPEGRLRLELMSESQARMTMRPNAPGGDLPAQLSFDVFYEREGNNLLVSLPGEDPMELVRDGRDYVASMNGETARFVRQ